MEMIINPPFNRSFGKHGIRYLCQFRHQGKAKFETTTAFDDVEIAMSYTSLIVRFISQVVEGKVLDNKTEAIVFTCHVYDRHPKLVRQVREVPHEYAQLAMCGFDLERKKVTTHNKKKVDEVFSKLRILHEELNAQLYARPTERPTIQTPAEAANILQYFIGALDHEELWVLLLDTRNRVMHMVALYKGSVNSSQVRVGEVFRQAIIDNAPSLIVAHNHPSGDCTPSPDDVAVTRSIVQAGKLLDIDVLDHLVIGGGRFVSLKERGLGF